MVYTDGAHLTADSLHELYSYANKIGLNPDWIDFNGKTLHPHFDICGRVKQRVLTDIEVKKVTCREIVRLCRVNFRLPETESQRQEWERHHKKSFSEVEKPSESEYDRMINNIFSRSGIERSGR